VDPGSINNIFSTDAADFDNRCLEMFRFQYDNNQIYRQWCDALGRTAGNVDSLEAVPFLPISFFKTNKVVTADFDAAVVFESSGTTATTSSRHYVKDVAMYRQSFLQAFHQFYGDPSDYCILALLPSYLERGGSSLVYMVNELISQSKHPDSGFYLHEYEALAAKLSALERSGQQTILFGVTYALLDFAEAHPMQLQNTTIIETGGMKGRKKEMTRWEVHQILQHQFGLKDIHSEYSMTELLSQAYSAGDGKFHCPSWMKILVRSEDDPLEVKQQGRGVVNIIDLANVYSCSFIATDDAGILHHDGSFEVLGRVDNSDVRGCSLLVL
jgi:phenylacetate-coenzyme A ligase PaaK-like adenylate-forming protein